MRGISNRVLSLKNEHFHLLKKLRRIPHLSVIVETLALDISIIFQFFFIMYIVRARSRAMIFAIIQKSLDIGLSRVIYLQTFRLVNIESPFIHENSKPLNRK